MREVTNFAKGGNASLCKICYSPLLQWWGEKIKLGCSFFFDVRNLEHLISAHTFASNRQLLFLNQGKGEMAVEIISWSISMNVLWTGWGSNLRPWIFSQTCCRQGCQARLEVKEWGERGKYNGTVIFCLVRKKSLFPVCSVFHNQYFVFVLRKFYIIKLLSDNICLH